MKAWCPECRIVEYVDLSWRCVWCGTVTLKSIIEREAHASRLLSIQALRKIHERYAAGATLAELGAEYFIGRKTLKHNFWAAGLPTRDPRTSNTLIARQRRVVRHVAEANGAYRRDLDNSTILAVYRRTMSMRATARELGCAFATVHRRLNRTRDPADRIRAAGL